MQALLPFHSRAKLCAFFVLYVCCFQAGLSYTIYCILTSITSTHLIAL